MKKMFSRFCVSALAATLIFSACSSSDQLADASQSVEDDAKLSLNEEFGGFESSDEQVAFGEADLLSDFPEDQDTDDSYMADPVVMDALDFSTDQPTDSNGVKAYFLRITYGLLAGDSSATEVLDWSGSAEVDKGTLVVLKTIRFEGNDFINRPRESRQQLSFTSQTKQHFDGLLLAIIDNDSTDTEGAFTFTAGGYSKTLMFSELDSLEMLEAVGALGHEVSITARSKEVSAFEGGFVAGRWIRTDANGGVFRGRWISSVGTSAGHVKGIWGIDRSGRKVFKGKYISLNGHFRGLIAGEWESDRNDNGGSFRGRVVNRNRQTIGSIHGKYKTGQAGDRRGFFHARYRLQQSDSAGDGAAS